MFNPIKNEIRFIETDDKKLSDAFWEGANHALEAIYDGTGIRYADYTEYRTRHPAALAFGYYFHPDHRTNGNIGEVTKQELIDCYKWLESPTTENYDTRIKRMCFMRSDADTRRVILQCEGVSTGIRLAFMSMRVQGLILLPMEFKLPIGATWIYNSDHRKQFYTPLAQFFLSFHRRTDPARRPSGNPVAVYYESQRGKTYSQIDWFSGTALSVCFAWSANTASEISIRDLVRMQHRSRSKDSSTGLPLFPEFSRTSAPWDKIISALEHEFPGDVRFTLEQKDRILYKHRNRFRHKNSIASRLKKWKRKDNLQSDYNIRIGTHRLSKCRELMFPVDIYTMDHDDFYSHCVQLDAYLFSPTLIEEAVKHLKWKVNESALSYWVEVATVYGNIKLKKQTSKPEALARLSTLFLYLFFYLPWWFEVHPTSKLRYPSTANELDPAIYGTRPVSINSPAPKPFVDFMYDRAQARDIDDNTLYSYMLSILRLFEWLKGRGSRYVKDANHVEMLFEHEDLPKSQARFGTTKNVFPKKLFKTIISYAYAALEFQIKMQELLESGSVTFADLQGRNGVLNPQHFGINLSALHLGTEYEISQIPSNFLKLPQLLYSDGRIVDTIHTGPAIHNILSLETGLRGRHIQWLDERTFDMFVQDQNLSKDIYPLHVNTDKRGAPWAPFVSRRVISLLRQMRQWKVSVGDPVFHQAVDYTHKETRYEKIYPVFASNNGAKPGPLPDYAYRDSWCALCIGLQWFCGQHNISDFSFVKYLPTGAKAWKPTYKANEVTVRGEDDADWADGLYCPVSLRNYVTPHGARATVVSLNISALPADVIGKYITGQTERVVYYYAKFNVEDMNDLHRIQGQKAFSTPSIIGNKAENNELDAVMLHCHDVNRKIAESVKDKAALGTAIEAFGLISLDSLTEKKTNSTGLDLLKNSKYSELGYNDSHICPFGNNCPIEIVEQYGQTMLCGICAYSIKSIDHLPAISAAKNAAIERLEGLTKTLERAYSSDTTDDERYKIDRRRDNQAMDALGWELSEEMLMAKVPDIRAGVEEGKFLTFEPEFVKNYLERVHTASDETSYLVARLNECIEYPSLETPQIRARFELAKRKLLASTGNLASLFTTVESNQPALDLYSLIKTIKETRKISNAELLAILRTDITELLPELRARPKLLGNVDD